MKRSKISDTQIVSILKQAEAGMPVKEVCRQHQISSACGVRIPNYAAIGS